MPSPTLSPRLVLACCLPVVLAAFVNGWYLPLLAREGMFWFWLADLLQWLLLPFLMLRLLARHGLTLSAAGFPWPLPQLQLPRDGLLLGGQALLVLASLALVYFAVEPLAKALFPEALVWFQFEDVELTGVSGRVLWLYSALTAGVVESLFYIGLPWLACRHMTFKNRAWLSPLAFSLLSALVFSSVHWEQGLSGLLSAFAFGLAACFWYFRLGHLWLVVLAHVAIDLYAFY